MAINESWCTAVPYGQAHLPSSKQRVKPFGLSLEDAQDKNDWRLKIKVATG